MSRGFVVKEREERGRMKVGRAKGAAATSFPPLACGCSLGTTLGPRAGARPPNPTRLRVPPRRHQSQSRPTSESCISVPRTRTIHTVRLTAFSLFCLHPSVQPVKSCTHPVRATPAAIVCVAELPSQRNQAGRLRSGARLPPRPTAGLPGALQPGNPCPPAPARPPGCRSKTPNSTPAHDHD